MKKLFLTLASVCSLLACTETDFVPNSNSDNFEALWSIIDKRYCYLDYKKINWDSIHAVYAAQVDNSLNKYEFFDLMSNMLAELKDGHVNLYSDFDISRYWEWYLGYPDNFSSSLIFSERYLGKNYRIAGGMRYGTIAGGQTGYIYYGDFSSSFSDQTVRNIFNQFSACRGLIIDVRGNGGGSLALSEKLASYFFENETVTGYIRHKTGNGHSDFSKAIEIKTPANGNVKWRLPVVVLSNRHSYSATNDFINRMKCAPRCAIAGDRTGGGAGLPFSSEIPNGWMLRFSASPMYNAQMEQTEWGIDPTVKIDISPQDAAAGIDSIIERAISEIAKL
jgi:hypothetical protein